MHLSYSEVINILEKMNRISLESDGAFRARLRHFQRLGFPKGSNTGKGRRAEYDLRMTLQLVLALEFLQAGITPTRIVELVNKNWSETETHLLIAATPEGFLRDAETGENYDPSLALCLSPEALRELTTDGESEYDYYEAFSFHTTKSITDLFNQDFAPNLGSYYRWIIILLKDLMHSFMHFTEKETSIEPVDILYELNRLLQEKRISIQDAMEKIEDVMKSNPADKPNGNS